MHTLLQKEAQKRMETLGSDLKSFGINEICDSSCFFRIEVWDYVAKPFNKSSS